MAFARASVQMFSLANPKYALASVAFYTVDVSGNATTTLAPLYGSVIGAGSLPNPQTLDSKGKFKTPVYIDQPVIGVITNGVLSPQTTGVISSFGRNRGSYVTATIYYENDTVQDPVSGTIYTVLSTFLSTNIAADITAGYLSVFISAATLLTGIISSSSNSMTIGLGSQSFTVEPGKSFTNGTWVVVANGTNSMSGPVTAYNSTTGAITVNFQIIQGSGTFASWNVEMCGLPGPTPQITATSSTSNTIGTGTLSFTTQANLALTAGMFVLINNTGTPANYVHGQITAYSGTTMVVNVTDFGGYGTISSWSISLSAPMGTITGALLKANNLSDLTNINTAFSTIAAGINGLPYYGTNINGSNDALPFYSASQSGPQKMAVQDLFRVTHGLTQKSTPSLSDEIPIYDVAGSAPKKITLTNLAAVIGGGNGGSTVTGGTSNLVLTNSSTRYQSFAPTTDGCLMVMPDATTITSTGSPVFLATNDGNYAFGIVDNGLNLIVALQSGESCYISLLTNSTAAGVWSYGVQKSLVGTLLNTFSQQTSMLVSSSITPDATYGEGCFAIAWMGSNTWVMTFTNKPGQSAGGAVYAIAFTYNPTTRSFVAGSPVSISTTAYVGYGLHFVYQITSTTALVIYQTNNSIKGQVISLSGTVVTAGTETALSATTMPFGTPFFYTVSAGTNYFLCWQNSNLRYLGITISGTTVAAGTLVSGGTPQYWTGSAAATDTYGGFYCSQISSGLFAITYLTSVVSAVQSNIACQLVSVSGTVVTAGTASSQAGYSIVQSTAANMYCPAYAFSFIAGYITVIAVTVGGGIYTFQWSYSGTTLTWLTVGSTINSASSIPFVGGQPTVVTWQRRSFIQKSASQLVIYSQNSKLTLNFGGTTYNNMTINGIMVGIGSLQWNFLQFLSGASQIYAFDTSGNGFYLMPTFNYSVHALGDPGIVENRFVL